MIKPTQLNQLTQKIQQYPNINPKEPLQPTDPTSLSGWMQLYFLLVVQTQSPCTQRAKRNDLNKFLQFYRQQTKSDDLRLWISPITQQFQNHLITLINAYKPSTINRAMMSIKHFAQWLTTRYPLSDGDPAKTIKDLTETETAWKGLTSTEIQTLESVLTTLKKERYKHAKRDTALFYALLGTGLRISELLNLNIEQYNNGAFHQVRRKNKRITYRVPLPTVAIQAIDAYLATRETQSTAPLFQSSQSYRLGSRGCRAIFEKMAVLARPILNDPHFHFSPHQLRHTFLKKITDQYGIHFAHRMSGNSSIREIFRYAKPSDEEISQCVETLF